MKRIFTRRELEQWLITKGFRSLKVQSGHKVYVHPTNGARVTLLGHGPKDLHPGVMGAILRDLERAGIPRDVVRRELGGA